jgi:endonuclease/exonuclease/phosphatase family metal-dependent hydrolase
VRKPPELVVMLAPALLVTVLVVVFGFVVDSGDEDEKPTAAPRSSVSASPTPSATDAVRKDPGNARPEGYGIQNKLVGPQVVIKARPRPKFRSIPSFSFTIASFNVLGHNHSVAGGDAARFADSGTRMGWTLGALANSGVDVVGLQELQPQQVGHLLGRGGGTWAVWPGHELGREAGANSIAWRRSEFELVKGETITVPYFEGNPWPMPYVLLRHRATGRQIWVASFHNPANKDSPKQNTGYRRVALGRESVLARSLEATGHPVFFTGDYNDRAEAFCPITTNTALKAANGGSTGSSCAPPDKMEVDWVFGSDRVTFSGYAALEGGLVGRASDHPLVLARATVPGYRERIIYPAGQR